MANADTQNHSMPSQRDWRPVVSERTFTWIAQLLIGAGLYWGYVNWHSGDLVIRSQAVTLFLAGVWASRLIRIRPAENASASGGATPTAD